MRGVLVLMAGLVPVVASAQSTPKTPAACERLASLSLAQNDEKPSGKNHSGNKDTTSQRCQTPFRYNPRHDLARASTPLLETEALDRGEGSLAW